MVFYLKFRSCPEKEEGTDVFQNNNALMLKSPKTDQTINIKWHSGNVSFKQTTYL